ncbi:MAG: CoA transferase [Chloroflexi bacterium]|nr:CoA transferase [Chloroflexota bacterium]
MADSLLHPYRALDLSEHGGQFCGKIMADLGADVIKVEPPGGDRSRNTGPFYKDIPHPERSLAWWAFNTSKRGITLDIQSREGRETFKRLAAKSDFVIESFRPGYIDSLGLGYNALTQVNPGLVVISISPFGQTGPYRDLKASDIVVMAMGGQMFSAGYPDRPPVRISVPQASLLAGAHAAAAGMVALTSRLRTGLGQHVDVSSQECVVRLLSGELSAWEFNREFHRREGSLRPAGGDLRIRIVWDCKDGAVTFRPGIGGYLRGMRPLVDWMVAEGAAGILKDVDWGALSPLVAFTKEVESWQDIFAGFFLLHTKAEMYEGALQRHIPLFPVFTPGEIVHDHQLADRNFWTPVEHPELGASFPYPGAATKLSLTPWRIHRRPPLIGEHNREVFAEMENPADSRTTADNPGGLNRLTELDGPEPKALAGLKVLDFSWFLAGPLITKYLADFGAQVVKIESKTNFDMTRASPPFKDGKPGPDRSASFRYYNTSKMDMSLKLSTPEGQALARKLAAWADVAVENFTPGVLARWGLDYEGLKKVNPRLIMLSTTNQGQSGPHSKHPGFGWNLSGLGGFNHVSGWPDREGVQPNAAYSDFATPWLAVAAILGAVDYRRRTGKGQYIDLSQYEAGLSYLSVPLLDFAVNGHERLRCGNHDDRACPHGAFPCRGDDHWCVLAAFTEAEWRSLCKVMGDPQWASDPRFASLRSRKEHEEELDRLVSVWTLEHSAEEVMDLLQEAGVEGAAVQNGQDLLEKDPQLRHRGFFQMIEHPQAGAMWHMGWPAILSRTPYRLRYAPSMGEHTDMICRDILKLSGEEIEELKSSGVFD